MVDDATLKYREPMAYGLLGAAALGVISALALLFKDGGDLGSNVGFAEKSAAFGTLFESSLVVLALVGAVLLVSRFGRPSPNARMVVLAAMGIGAVDALFAVITFLAQFGSGSDAIGPYFAGVLGAGKVVGVILGLAHLLFLAVALLYVYTVFQSLPAPAAATTGWAAWPGQPGGQPGVQPGGPTGVPPGQPGGQPFGSYGGGNPAYPAGGWTPQGWNQPVSTPSGQQPGWAPGAPVQPEWSQAWGRPAPSGWGSSAQPAHQPAPQPGQGAGYPPAPPPGHQPPAPQGPTAQPPSYLPSDGRTEGATPAGATAEEPPEPPTDLESGGGSEPAEETSSPARGWWQHPGS